MKGIWESIQDLRGERGAKVALGLGLASFWLILAAFVGAVAVSGDDDGTTDLVAADDFSEGDGDLGFLDDDGTAAPSVDPDTGLVIDEATGAPLPGQTARPGATTPGGPAATVAPTPGAGTVANPNAPVVSPTGGDTTGVTASTIKIGVHAPITFSGVPLGLADDPIKGVHTYVDYINDHGGIHGRKIAVQVEDDRFDSEGAQRAAQALINDGKNFMVSGTLGIDQVAIVAAEAQRRGVPYSAAGGPEFVNPVPGMFQLAANYDTHVIQLAAFMGSDPKYQGKRVGILVSDSAYIRPTADTFKQELEKHGLSVSTIVENQKPAQNPDYNGYILEFRSSDTEVVVPLTDPLTTQQIVQRCAAGAACGWTYSFSNFAHDSDTALALLVPTWRNQQVRGLSSGCYYMAPEVEGPNCAQMRTAREQWVAVHGQQDWVDNGSGGASGYQIVSFIKGALLAPGADLTRQRFVAGWRSYSAYSDLVTGPITFAGSSNVVHGAEQMTVLEAQSNNKYKMITPGLVNGF